MENSKNEAKERLSAFLPHLQVAMESAKLEGFEGTQMGVLGVNLDGSGKIIARFECDFIKDLAVLLELD